MYEGQRKDGQRDGTGCEYDEEGHLVYEGGWKNGLRHGYGKEWYTDSGTLHYVGHWVEGKKNGYCEEYVEDDLGVYKGDWKDDRRHGMGKWFSITSSGATVLVYDGEFVNDDRHGTGTEFHSDGSVSYVGQWERDGRHGTGQTFYCDGYRHDGEWRRDKMDGKGTVTHNGVPFFSGQWKDNVRQGHGILFEEKSFLAGVWTETGLRGRRVAYDHSILYEGDFCGRWSSIQRAGSGKEYRDGALVYDGSWFDDKRHGPGTLHHPDGNVAYKGEWLHHKRHGRGTSYAADGTVVYDGVWVEDVPEKEHVVKQARRDEIAALHLAADGYVGTVPTCVVCFADLHHGDTSYAYVPCGHRVLCETCGVDPRCARQCLVCKTTAVPMRIF